MMASFTTIYYGMSRNAPSKGGALRDIPKDGREGDYLSNRVIYLLDSISIGYVTMVTLSNSKKGRSRDFSKGGGVTLCQTKSGHQLVTETSTPCFTLSSITLKQNKL